MEEELVEESLLPLAPQLHLLTDFYVQLLARPPPPLVAVTRSSDAGPYRSTYCSEIAAVLISRHLDSGRFRFRTPC
ncbi:hypothetical protein RU639_005642 [Aspergillus parasiticus]